MLVLVILLLSLSSLPALANSDRKQSDRPGRSDVQGRADVRVEITDLTPDGRAGTTLYRGRDGSTSLKLSGAKATGTSDCPRGRCADLHESNATIDFNRFDLDLRVTERPEEIEADGRVQYIYRFEVRGRTDGVAEFNGGHEEEGIFYSRWSGGISGTLSIKLEGVQLDDLGAAAEVWSGEVTDIDLDITGIVIDFPSTGIVMHGSSLQIIIDHVGAG